MVCSIKDELNALLTRGKSTDFDKPLAQRQCERQQKRVIRLRGTSCFKMARNLLMPTELFH